MGGFSVDGRVVMSESWIKVHSDLLNSEIMAEDVVTKWILIVCWLMTWPTSCAATTRNTRTRPVSGLTATSAICVPKAYVA